MKILVADDDVISRRIMQKMLQGNGYEVVTADDGRKAANELARKDGPRLALVDWMMPELDGPGVCREVRSRHDDSYIYILLLTSKQSNEDLVAGLEAGADDYLTKPCPSAELKARLLTGQRILQLEDRLVEAREEMRFRATHDSLTLLWDRGAIMSLLQSELHRASRSGNPVSILLCDVDHFKNVNDTCGHAAGDGVLREISARFLRSVRQYDAVGRYGGEEFLLILSNTTPEQIKMRANKIREAIAGTPIALADRNLPVTISIGAVTIQGSELVGSTELLLHQADAALYQAKADGRNRVVCSELIASKQL